MTRVCRFLFPFVVLCAPIARADDAASVVVIVGAAGAPEYGTRFAGWAQRWREAARRGGARVTVVGGEGDGPDRPRVEAALAREAAGQGPLWVVLLGHGTFDGRTAKLNLRGPDASAEDLARWLAPVRRPLVVVAATSASGPLVKALTGPDRVVVTATRSGREQNATRFGGFFAEAVADAQADLDKDGQTSVLEAFLWASRRVDASFTDAGQLATEHALIEDNGDGVGTPASFFQGVRPARKAASNALPDGHRAHQLALVPSEPERALSPEQRRRRDALELKVLELRDQRAKLGDDQYYARLEPLLLELARLYARR